MLNSYLLTHSENYSLDKSTNPIECYMIYLRFNLMMAMSAIYNVNFDMKYFQDFTYNIALSPKEKLIYMYCYPYPVNEKIRLKEV